MKYNISTNIFILVLETVFTVAKINPNIQGINISRYVFLHTVYADDSTFFLEEKN